MPRRTPRPPVAPPEPPPLRGAALLWAAAVVVLAVALYVPAIRNGFALDDVPLVEHDPRIASLAGLPKLLLAPYWAEGGVAAGLYRPLATASFVLNRALTGPGPGGFHAVNVALHGLVCLLVWLWARRIGTAYGTALVTATLFAVHPIHVEAVANVAGRAELLAAVFVLAGWLAHLRAGRAAGPREARPWVAAAALAVLAAALSKEHAVVAPALYLAVDRFLPARPARRTTLAAAAAYGAALVAVLALRVEVLGGLGSARDTVYLDNPAAFEPPAVRVATALWVQVRELALVLWPARLSSDYSFAAVAIVRTATDPRLFAGIAVLAGWIALGRAGRRQPPVPAGVLVWLGFLLPSANLVFPTGTLMAERLLYLPSLGVCLLAGHAGARAVAAAAPSRRRAAAAAVVAGTLLAAGALAIRTVRRTPAWADNATLALTDVATEPGSAKLQAGAAIALHARGDLVAAEPHYRRALEIWPDYAQMHYDYGVLLEARGRVAEALEHYRQAATLAPGNPAPRRAIAALERGRPE